jgi:thiol-disulfide isomerase/thioredoxin
MLYANSDKWGKFFIIIGALISISMLLMYIGYIDSSISYDKYNDITKWCGDCKELIPYVDKASIDDRITVKEYNDIERKYHILKMKNGYFINK